MANLEKIAERLYQLLEQVDKIADSVQGDREAFYNLTMETISKRTGYGELIDQEIIWKDKLPDGD